MIDPDGRTFSRAEDACVGRAEGNRLRLRPRLRAWVPTVHPPNQLQLHMRPQTGSRDGQTPPASAHSGQGPEDFRVPRVLVRLVRFTRHHQQDIVRNSREGRHVVLMLENNRSDVVPVTLFYCFVQGGEL